MIALYIIGGVVVCVGSFVGTVAVAFKSRLDLFEIAAKRGYKINATKLEEIGKNLQTTKEKNKGKKNLGIVLGLTPIVNVTRALISRMAIRRACNKMFESEKFEEYKDCFVPMSDEEKEEFSQLKTRKERLNFAVENIEEDDFDVENSSDNVEYMGETPEYEITEIKVNKGKEPIITTTTTKSQPNKKR